jgi:hypothetical protein
MLLSSVPFGILFPDPVVSASEIGPLLSGLSAQHILALIEALSQVRLSSPVLFFFFVAGNVDHR